MRVCSPRDLTPQRGFALLWIALLILGSLSVAACGPGEDATEGDAATEEVAEGDEVADGDESGEESDEDKPERRERSVTVSAVLAKRGELVVPVVAEGVIRARSSAEIKFELTGRIARLHVREGQRVRRGDRLATLDDREYQVALEEARSNYLQSLGQLAVEDDEVVSATDAQRELNSQLEELEAMLRRGEITRDEQRAREMELGIAAVKDGAYRRELLEVRSGLASARAAEARAELNLEKTVLRAPFNGVVSGLVLTSGERVQTGSTLCTVVDDIEVEAEIGVLESDLKVLEPGRPALVTIPALDRTFQATVDVISPAIDPDSRTCQILMRLRSEDGKIKPGMFVRASIAGEIHPDKLLVPREAILSRDGRPLLFRVEGDRAKWVYVELGLRNDNAVEITRVVQGGPLDMGTPIVVDNHLTLTHDAKVKVRSTTELEDPWASYALSAAREK